MTPEQHRKIQALNECRPQKGDQINYHGFIRRLAAYAQMHPDNEQTEQQAQSIEALCWHYRRQMPDDLVPKAKPSGWRR